MNNLKIFKSIFASLLLFCASQAQAQTTIAHEGGFIKYLDKTYERLEEIEPYPATISLSINPETAKYAVTITPEKGAAFTFEFTKPTRKEKCASFAGKGKNNASGIRLQVSGLDCKIAHPKITIRDQKKEYFFLLTEAGNEQAVTELKKVWVKK